LGYNTYIHVIFFFYKIREQEGRTSSVLGVGTSVEEGCRRVNMLQILCTNVCKWKNDDETIPEMEGGSIKKNDELLEMPQCIPSTMVKE
jgi:hypothetical protein